MDVRFTAGGKFGTDERQSQSESALVRHQPWYYTVFLFMGTMSRIIALTVPQTTAALVRDQTGVEFRSHVSDIETSRRHARRKAKATDSILSDGL